MSREIELVFRRGGELQDQQPKKTSSDTPFAQLDLVFVIDTTGSMEDKIDSLIRKCQEFVDKLASKNIDWRIATVAFGDLEIHPPDKIVAAGFSDKIQIVKSTLGRVPRFSGGGNEGESCLEALDKALTVYRYRPDAIKAFILLTDEPALQNKRKPVSIISRLRQLGILTFVIATGHQYYKDMASQTGGKWFAISANTNFDPILDQLITSVTTIVVAVQEEAGGDVQKYLQLKEGS